LFNSGPTKGIIGHVILYRPTAVGTVTLTQLDSNVANDEDSTAVPGSLAFDKIAFFGGTDQWDKAGVQVDWPAFDIVPPTGYTDENYATDIHLGATGDNPNAYHTEPFWKQVAAADAEAAVQYTVSRTGGPGGGSYAARAWQGYIAWTAIAPTALGVADPGDEDYELVLDLSSSVQGSWPIATYAVTNWGDGQSDLEQASPLFSHVYASGGLKTISIRVRDDHYPNSGSEDTGSVSGTAVIAPEPVSEGLLLLLLKMQAPELPYQLHTRML